MELRRAGERLVRSSSRFALEPYSSFSIHRPYSRPNRFFFFSAASSSRQQQQAAGTRGAEEQVTSSSSVLPSSSSVSSSSSSSSSSSPPETSSSTTKGPGSFEDGDSILGPGNSLTDARKAFAAWSKRNEPLLSNLRNNKNGNNVRKSNGGRPLSRFQPDSHVGAYNVDRMRQPLQWQPRFGHSLQQQRQQQQQQQQEQQQQQPVPRQENPNVNEPLEMSDLLPNLSSVIPAKPPLMHDARASHHRGNAVGGSAQQTRAERWADAVKRLDRPLHLSPRTGRTVPVVPESMSDLAIKLRRLDRLVLNNGVPQLSRFQKFHERPGLRRKRLKSLRWRKRFKDAFKRVVRRVMEMRKKGW